MTDKKLSLLFHSRFFLPISCLVIFLLSLYLRSLIDIGADTGVYINLGKKVAQGGRYYFDFFESNFPISFYLYALQFWLAEILAVSPIILSEITINLLAILSIFWSSRILKNTTIYNSKTHYDFILISYCLSFFLRPYALQIGEFGTKTSLLLIALYPYISFSFERKIAPTKIDLTCRGMLMGLIPCIKPHYLCLMIFVEIHRFFQKKSVRFLAELDKLVMCLIGLSYLLLMLKFTPEFFEFMLPMWQKSYSAYNNQDVFIDNFWRHIASRVTVFAFIFLMFSRLKFDANDKILLLFFAGASTLIILENIGTVDQVVTFYAIATICFSKFLPDLFSSQKFSLSDNKFISFTLIFLPIFDLEILPASIFGLGGFINIWWLVALVYPAILAKKLTAEQRHQFFSTKKIFAFFLAYSSLLCFAFLTLRHLGGWAYISVNLSILFAVLFFFERKIYGKISAKFSPFFVFTILTSLSCLLYAHITAAVKLIGRDSYYTYPNKISDFTTHYSQIYAPKKEDEILMVSIWIAHRFPLLNYLQKESSEKFHVAGLQANQGHSGSFLMFPTEDRDLNFTLSYLFDDVKNQLKNPHLKIIFINNTAEILDKKTRCLIGSLEYYFLDPEFKKLFLKNFHFENHVILTKQVKPLKKLRFISGEKSDIFDQIKPTTRRVMHDFEVYVRNEEK